MADMLHLGGFGQASRAVRSLALVYGKVQSLQQRGLRTSGSISHDVSIITALLARGDPGLCSAGHA